MVTGSRCGGAGLAAGLAGWWGQQRAVAAQALVSGSRRAGAEFAVQACPVDPTHPDPPFADGGLAFSLTYYGA